MSFDDDEIHLVKQEENCPMCGTALHLMIAGAVCPADGCDYAVGTVSPVIFDGFEKYKQDKIKKEAESES